MGDEPETLHGTAIAVGTRAALIVGRSGAGKSDLALRCLALAPSALLPQPARLVADDRAIITPSGDGLRVSAPHSLRGKLEVRGLGVVEVPYLAEAELVLIAELVAAAEVERLPDPPPRRTLLGIDLPLVRLAPFEASAPAKLLLALAPAGPPGRA